MDNVAQNFPPEPAQLASWLFLYQLLPLELRAQGKGMQFGPGRPSAVLVPWMVLGKLLFLSGLSVLSHKVGIKWNNICKILPPVFGANRAWNKLWFLSFLFLPSSVGGHWIFSVLTLLSAPCGHHLPFSQFHSSSRSVQPPLIGYLLRHCGRKHKTHKRIGRGSYP